MRAGALLEPYDFKRKRFEVRVEAPLCEIAPPSACMIVRRGGANSVPSFSDEFTAMLTLRVEDERLARALANSRDEGGYVGDTEIILQTLENPVPPAKAKLSAPSIEVRIVAIQVTWSPPEELRDEGPEAADGV